MHEVIDIITNRKAITNSWYNEQHELDFSETDLIQL